MLRFYGSIVILVPALVTILTACEGTGSANGEQKGVAGAVTDSAGSNAVGMPSGAEAARNGSSGQGSAAASGQTPMQPPGSPPLIDAGKPSVANDAGRAPDNAMPDASVSNAMDAAQSDSGRGARPNMNDLSGKVLAMWGSSVCDGFSVPRGTGWPWLVEKKLSEINGPMVLHASTSGHTTDSKESSLERNKIKSANFVVICLSLGNQGLGDTATEASAQAVVDSYLDDIFTDDSDSDGDPVSLVKYIQSLGAYPIVTLVYPMAAYSTMHCQHVVKANILQQSYGIATVNHLGPTNAGNDFGPGDCTWSNGRNAPVNVESDARHPNQLGHEEAY